MGGGGRGKQKLGEEDGGCGCTDISFVLNPELRVEVVLPGPGVGIAHHNVILLRHNCNIPPCRVKG